MTASKNIRHQSTLNRNAARKRGDKTYHGTMCRHHNITERFCRGHQCVLCRKESKKKGDNEFKKAGPAFLGMTPPPAFKRHNPWPAMQLEDVVTHDHIGSRHIHRVVSVPAGYESSIADIC